MSGQRGLTSIVVTCHNSGAYVAEGLDAALAQRDTEIEVVVVDDGSTDNTVDEVERVRARDARVRLCRRQVSHGGPAKARNVGITHSNGDVVTIVDADDLLRPNAVSLMRQLMRDAPDVGMVCFNSELSDFATGLVVGDGLREYEGFWRLKRRTVGDGLFVIDDDRRVAQLVRTNFVRTSGVSIRAAVLEEVGHFDERLTNADDWDLWLRIARRHPIGFVDHPAVVYRIRANNISARGGARLLPNQIRVLEAAMARETDARARLAIRTQLAVNYAALGWASRVTGDFSEAKRLYRRSLGNRANWEGVRGLALAYLRRGGRSG